MDTLIEYIYYAIIFGWAVVLLAAGRSLVLHFFIVRFGWCWQWHRWTLGLHWEWDKGWPDQSAGTDLDPWKGEPSMLTIDAGVGLCALRLVSRWGKVPKAGPDAPPPPTNGTPITQA